MDQKLLQALNNVSFSLESLVDALKENNAKSSTAEVIKSGNFGKQLESITVELKSIKSDTQKILKNQETIISLSKEKEKEKTQSIENAGTEEQKNAIKKGVGSILLIAGAVLAIGLAFKIIGNVDFVSVISLSLAIVIMANAFERVAKIEGLSIKTASIVSASLVIMSIALSLSSVALSLIRPVSATQLLTGIMIGSMLAVVSFSLQKMISAFRGNDLKEIGYSVLFLPLILTSISIAIALSSYALANVQPISLAQLFTSTLIAITFVALSYAMSGLIGAFKGKDIKSVALAAIFLPVILPAISIAIAGASYALQLVQPIGLAQFFSAVMIGVVFTILAFGMKYIISAFEGINAGTAMASSIIIPLLYTSMSVAIWLSSEMLSKVVPVSLSQFLTSIAIGLTFVVLAYALVPIIKVADEMDGKTLAKLPLLFTIMSVAIMASSYILSQMESLSDQQMKQAAILGGTLAVIALIMIPAMKILGKLGTSELLKGSLAIVIVATTIMVTSHILSIGDYSTYPELGWIIGVGISLTTFGLAAFALGTLVFGPQALVFLAGLAAVLGVAATIVGVSKILKSGEYSNTNMLEWAKATALLYATFTPIMLILGTAALASSVVSIFGPDPWKMAQTAMLDVADTIVKVSHKLQEGNYSEGPSKEWAEGISTALGAFSPVYAMLMKNSIFSMFSGGVSPDDFSNAIITVSDGIITAANKFASASASFENGPSKEWADGISAALGAFSPVYGMLMKNSIFSIFGGGISPDDFSKAISTVSDGIITAANKFASASASFEGGPSKEWADGISAALGAFSPVYGMLMKNSIFSIFGSGVSSDDFSNAIITVSDGIVTAANKFSSASASFEGGPSKEWSDGISAALGAFSPVYGMLMDNSVFSRVSPDELNKAILTVSDGIITAAGKFSNASATFKEGPSKEWAEGIAIALGAFSPVYEMLMDNSVFGRVSPDELNKAILTVSDGIITAAGKFSNASATFKEGPSKEWAEGVSTSLGAFSSVYSMLMDNSIFNILGIGVTPEQFSNAIIIISDGIVTAANKFSNALFKEGPTKEWAEGVGLSLGAFSSVYGMLMDNSIFNIFGLGVTPEQFTSAIITVSDGIITAANKFSSASTSFQNGPSKEWAEGMAIALGAFSPVYGMLMDNSIFNIFGLGVTPEQFSNAIITVSDGVITAANKFSGISASFVNGPSKEWAEGVAIALGAFSPVYGMLMNSSVFDIFSGGVSPEEFNNAIITVSDGIITSANMFSESSVSFEGGPSKEWADGIAKSLSAFSPVYEALVANSGWFKSNVSVEDMRSAIVTISQGIVDAALFFSKNSTNFEEGNYPSENWSKGIGAALGAFAPIFKSLSEDTGWFTSSDDVIKSMSNGVMALSNSLVNAANIFSSAEGSWDSYPNASWVDGVARTISSYIGIFDELDDRGYTMREISDKSNVLKSIISSISSVARSLSLNDEIFNSEDSYSKFYNSVLSTNNGIIWRFTNLLNRLNSQEDLSSFKLKGVVNNLVKTAEILHDGQSYFSASIDPDYMENISKNIIDFNNLINILVTSENNSEIIGYISEVDDYLLGNDPISKIAKKMVTLAKGYDKLADSLNKLGLAMKTLNITDVKMLGGLNKTLLVTNANVDKLSLDKNEASANFINDKNITSVNNRTIPVEQNKPDDNLSSKLDEVIRLLSNIDKSTGSVDSLISQYIGDEDAPKDTNSFF